MTMRRILAVFACFVMVFSLTSCQSLEGDNDAMLMAPKPTGEMYGISQALEHTVGKDIDLKYPKKGQHLSAFTLYDVDGDGEDEAIAFYSFTNNNSGEINVSLIDKTQGEWGVVDSAKLAAANVESLSFADLDGNGTMEVIVGWNVFSGLEKQVAAYAADNGKFTQRLLENYSEFVICNLLESDFSQILTVFHNTANKTTIARLMHLNSAGGELALVEEGNTQLDGNINSYLPPVNGKLANGNPCVYIDAYKGNSSMITEILYYAKPTLTRTDTAVNSLVPGTQPPTKTTGGLVSPFHDEPLFDNEITFRQTAMPMWDIDGDGVIEMPSLTEFPGYGTSNDSGKVYLATWRNYDSMKFTAVKTAVMNYTEGYYITVPEIWATTATSNITVSRNADHSVMSFNAWDMDTGAKGDELFRIHVFTRDAWERRNVDEFGEYFVILTEDNKVYSGFVYDSKHPFTMTEQQIKSAFVRESSMSPIVR